MPELLEDESRPEVYLFHLLTAALHSLVGVDSCRYGGQFLSFLTLAHLRVDAVDEALHYGHLEEEKHKKVEKLNLAKWVHFFTFVHFPKILDYNHFVNFLS